MGGHRPHFVTPFLLCASFFLLFFTTDDYVECTDLFPDEVLDCLGLMEIPLEDLAVPFLYVLLGGNQSVNHPNQLNLFEISLTITSRVILSTVIRI